MHRRSEENDRLIAKLKWRSDDEGGRFLHLMMDQNNVCNLKCRMCGFSDPRASLLPRQHMPRWLFERIARETFPHASYLTLSLMTEPFMTPDFPDRLQLVRRHGVPFSDIITNGTLLNRSNLTKVFDAGISRLTFSIDGGTKEVYESIRVNARFETVTRNLDLFLEMREERGVGPRLRINHVLSEINIDHFEGFLNLVESIRPDDLEVRTVVGMGQAEIGENRDPRFWLKVRDARRAMTALCGRAGIENSGYLRETPDRIDLWATPSHALTCARPWNMLALHADGEAHPCMSWTRGPVGDFSKQSFKEIWNGPQLRAIRREFEHEKPGVDCNHCVIRRGPDDPDDDYFLEKLGKRVTEAPGPGNADL